MHHEAFYHGKPTYEAPSFNELMRFVEGLPSVFEAPSSTVEAQNQVQHENSWSILAEYSAKVRAMTLSMLRSALFAAMILVTAPTIAQESEQPIRVGMSGGYFPFTFVRNDELQGFEVDLMNAIGAEIGRNVEFETMSFSGLIGALQAGRIDTIGNQITITPEREEAFAFSEPYVYDGAQIVVKAGNEDTIKDTRDLSGKTVAVNLGSNFEQLLRELPNADDIDIRTYESNIEQDTALGRTDAFVMDRVSSAQVIAESPLPLALAGQPFSEIRNAYPFRDTEEGRELRDEVNGALDRLRENGTLSKISEKWLSSDVTTPQ
ncbi:amino acid ABC transporter substrate-binding protein [Fulvimarina endophytica]|nr:amino acid ABC transporter substrate-binding protein [Fulvimarina endophytica]